MTIKHSHLHFRGFYFNCEWMKTSGQSVSDPALRSCVKVQVAVLGSPSLIARTVSVEVKQH